MNKILARIIFIIVLLICAIYIQFYDNLYTVFGVKANTIFIIALITFGIYMLIVIANIDHVLDDSKNIYKDLIHNRTNPYTYLNSTSFEVSFEYLAHLFASSLKIIEIQNTIIGPAVVRDIPNYGKFVSSKNVVINSGASWYDLISLENTGRLLGIIKSISEFKGNYFLSATSINGLNKSTFLNFTLINGIDSLGQPYKEVLLGWESTPFMPDQKDEIIILRDERIYQRYKRHFDFLWSNFSNKISIQEMLDGSISDIQIKNDLKSIFETGMLYNTQKKCHKCKIGDIYKFPGFSSFVTICSQYGNGCNFVK